MPSLPTLQTQRLLLRPFTQADAPEVQRLAGVWEVAATTLHIPRPYPDGAAEAWIETHAAAFDRGEGLTLAITFKGTLIGAVGLGLEPAHHRAELGYWIGRDTWGQGYATETANAVIRFGFDQECASKASTGSMSGRMGAPRTSLVMPCSGPIRASSPECSCAS